MDKKPSRALIERMRNGIRRQELRESGGAPQAASFHRRPYHREFEGYTETRQLTAAGHIRIRRIYTGPRYEPEEPVMRRIVRRFLYSLCLLGAMLCFYFSAAAAIRVNTLIYVSAFHALLFPALLWSSYVLLFYSLEPGSMTIGNYKSLHLSLIRSFRITSLLFLGNVLCLVIGGFLLNSPLSVVFPLLLTAAASICTWMVSALEQKLPYRTIPGSDPPEDGSRIELNDVSHL